MSISSTQLLRAIKSRAREITWLYPIYYGLTRWKSFLFGPKLPVHLEESYRPFFIVGSGRSGSTLLRRILQASPEVHIPPETYVLYHTGIPYFCQNRHRPWPELVRYVLALAEFDAEFQNFEISFRPLVKELSNVPVESRSLALILNKFYCYHGNQTRQPFERWGDKTPTNAFNMKRILLVFPDARFVHLIRDGADVVLSYVKGGILPNLETAARHWISSLQAVQRFAKRHASICYEIRYEDLVTDPLSTVKSLCEFLDLRFYKSMTDCLDHTSSMGDVNRYQHHSNVKKPINTLSIGKGRKELTSEQKHQLGHIINSELIRLGYDLLV